MAYTDLLRVTVLLTAGEATALGAVTVISATGVQDTTTLIVTAAWWAIAVILGLRLGSPERASEGVREPLAQARTVTADSPPASVAPPGRTMISRLWPIAVTAVVAGGLGVFWAPVSGIGSGYALLVSLAWRHRESAVEAIEQRDGVRFLVEPGSALKPIKLTRTPGFTRF